MSNPLDLDTDLAADIETWLRGLPLVEPIDPVLWVPEWRENEPRSVHALGHLLELVDGLGADGFAGVIRGSSEFRAQVCRCRGQFHVEVRSPALNNFYHRVHHGDAYSKAADRFTAVEAAEIMWRWVLGGVLADGLNVTLDHYTPDDRPNF
jgi:hypothetical protein